MYPLRSSIILIAALLVLLLTAHKGSPHVAEATPEGWVPAPQCDCNPGCNTTVSSGSILIKDGPNTRFKLVSRTSAFNGSFNLHTATLYQEGVDALVVGGEVSPSISEASKAPLCIASYNTTIPSFDASLTYPQSTLRVNESIFNLQGSHGIWAPDTTTTSGSVSSGSPGRGYHMATVDSHWDGIPNITTTSSGGSAVNACHRTGVVWGDAPAEVSLSGNTNPQYNVYAMSFPRVSSTAVPAVGSSVPNMDLFADPLLHMGDTTDRNSPIAAQLSQMDAKAGRTFSSDVETTIRSSTSQGGSTSRSRFVSRVVGIGWDASKAGRMLDQQQHTLLYTSQGRALINALATANNQTGIVVDVAPPISSPSFQRLMLKALTGYTVDSATGVEVPPTTSQSQPLGLPVRMFADNWVDLRFLDDTWWSAYSSTNRTGRCPVGQFQNYSALASYVMRSASRGDGRAVSSLFRCVQSLNTTVSDSSLPTMLAFDVRFDIRERRRLVQEKLWKLGRRVAAIENTFRGSSSTGTISNDTVVLVGELISPSDSYLEEARLYRNKPYLFDKFDTVDAISSYTSTLPLSMNASLTLHERRILQRTGNAPTASLIRGDKLTAISAADTLVGLGGYIRGSNAPRTSSLDASRLFSITYKQLQDAVMRPLDALLAVQLEEEATMMQLLEESFTSSLFTDADYESNFVDRLRIHQSSMGRKLLYHPLCGLGSKEGAMSAQGEGGVGSLFGAVQTNSSCVDSSVAGCARVLRRDRCFNLGSFGVLPAQLLRVLRDQASSTLPTADFVPSMFDTPSFWQQYTKNISTEKVVLGGLPLSGLHMGALGQVSLRVSVRSSLLSAIGDVNSLRYASGVEVGAAAGLRSLQRARDSTSVHGDPTTAAAEYFANCANESSLAANLVESRLQPTPNVLGSHLHFVVGGPSVGLLDAWMVDATGVAVTPTPIDTAHTSNGSQCTPTSPSLLSACVCKGPHQPTFTLASPVNGIRYTVGSSLTISDGTVEGSSCEEGGGLCDVMNGTTTPDPYLFSGSLAMVSRERMIQPSMLLPGSSDLMDEKSLRHSILFAMLDLRPEIKAAYASSATPSSSGILFSEEVVAMAVDADWLRNEVEVGSGWWDQAIPSMDAPSLRTYLLGSSSEELISRLGVQFTPPTLESDQSRWRRLIGTLPGYGYGTSNLAAMKNYFYRSDETSYVSATTDSARQDALDEILQLVLQRGGRRSVDVLGTPFTSFAAPVPINTTSSSMSQWGEEGGVEVRYDVDGVDTTPTFAEELFSRVLPGLLGAQKAAQRGFVGYKCAFDSGALASHHAVHSEAVVAVEKQLMVRRLDQGVVVSSNVTYTLPAGVTSEYVVCRVRIPPTASAVSLYRSASLPIVSGSAQVYLRQYDNTTRLLLKEREVSCQHTEGAGDSCRRMSPCAPAPIPVSGYTVVEVRVPLHTFVSRLVSTDVLELDSTNTLQDPLQDGSLPYTDGSPNTASNVCPAQYAVDVYFYEGSDPEVSSEITGGARLEVDEVTPTAVCNASILHRFGGNISFLHRFGELTITARAEIIATVFNSRPATGDDALPWFNFPDDPVSVTTLAFPRAFADTVSPSVDDFDTRTEQERIRYFPALSTYQVDRLEEWSNRSGLTLWVAPSSDGCLSMLELCDGSIDTHTGADEAVSLCGGATENPRDQAARLGFRTMEPTLLSTPGCATAFRDAVVESFLPKPTDFAPIAIVYAVNVSTEYTATLDTSGYPVGPFTSGPPLSTRSPVLGAMLPNNASLRTQCIPEVPLAFRSYSSIPRSACLGYVRAHNIAIAYFTLTAVAASKLSADDLGSCVTVPTACTDLLFGGKVALTTNATNLADVLGVLLGHREEGASTVTTADMREAYWGMHYPTAFVSRSDESRLEHAKGSPDEATIKAEVVTAAAKVAETSVTYLIASPTTLYRPFISASPASGSPLCSSALHCNANGYAVPVGFGGTAPSRVCRCVCDSPWSGPHCDKNILSDEESSAIIVQGRYRPMPLGSLSNRTAATQVPPLMGSSSYSSQTALNATHTRLLQALCTDALWETTQTSAPPTASSLVAELLSINAQYAPSPSCSALLLNLSTALDLANTKRRPLSAECVVGPIVVKSTRYGDSYANGVPIGVTSYFDEVRLQGPTQASNMLTRGLIGDLFNGLWTPSTQDAVRTVSGLMPNADVAHTQALLCLQSVGAAMASRVVGEVYSTSIPARPHAPIHVLPVVSSDDTSSFLSISTYPRTFAEEVLLNPILTPLLTPLSSLGTGLDANSLSQAPRNENITITTTFAWLHSNITDAVLEDLVAGRPNTGHNLSMRLVPATTMTSHVAPRIDYSKGVYVEEMVNATLLLGMIPPTTCTASSAAGIASGSQSYPVVTCMWDGVNASVSAYVGLQWSFSSTATTTSAIQFLENGNVRTEGPYLVFERAVHPLSAARTREIAARLDNSVDQATGRTLPYFFQDSEYSTRIFLIGLVIAFTASLATGFFAIGARLKDGSTKREAQIEASRVKHTLLQAKDSPLSSKIHRSRRAMLGWCIRIFSMTQRYGGVHWLLRYDRCFIVSLALSFLCVILCVLCALGLVFGEQFAGADYYMLVEVYPNDNCRAKGLSQEGVSSHMISPMAHSAGWSTDVPLRVIMVPADGTCQSTTILDRFPSVTRVIEPLSIGIAKCSINQNQAIFGTPTSSSVKRCDGLKMMNLSPYSCSGPVGTMKAWNQSSFLQTPMSYTTKSYCIRKDAVGEYVRSWTKGDPSQGSLLDSIPNIIRRRGSELLATVSSAVMGEGGGVMTKRRAASVDDLAASLPTIEMSPNAAIQQRSSSAFTLSQTPIGAQRYPFVVPVSTPHPLRIPSTTSPLQQAVGVPSTYYQYTYSLRSGADVGVSTSISSARLVSSVAALAAVEGPEVYHTVPSTVLSQTYYDLSHPAIASQGDAPIGALFDDPPSSPRATAYPARLSGNAQGSSFDIGSLASDAFSFMFWIKASSDTKGVVLAVTDDWRKPTQSSGMDLPLLRAIDQLVGGRGEEESSWPYPKFSVYYAIHVDSSSQTLSFVSVRGVDSPAARSYRDYVEAASGVSAIPTSDFNIVLTWNVSSIPSTASSSKGANSNPSLFDSQWHQVALVVSSDEDKAVETDHLEMTLLIDGSSRANHVWDKCLGRRLDGVTNMVRYPLTSLATSQGDILNGRGVAVVGALSNAALYAVEVFDYALTIAQITAQGTSIMQQDTGFTTIYFAALGIYVLFAAAAILAITVMGVIQESISERAESKAEIKTAAVSSYKVLFDTSGLDEDAARNADGNMVTSIELRRPTYAIKAPAGVEMEDDHLRGNNIDPFALYYVPNWKKTVEVIGMSTTLFITMLAEIHKVTDSLSAARAQVLAIMWKQGVTNNMYVPTSSRFKGLLEQYRALLITDLVTDSGESFMVPPDLWNDFARRLDPALDRAIKKQQDAAPSLDQSNGSFSGFMPKLSGSLQGRGASNNAGGAKIDRPALGRGGNVRINTNATTTSATSGSSVGSSSSAGSAGTTVIEALRPVITSLQSMSIYTVTFPFPITFTAIWSTLLTVFSFDLLNYLTLNVPDIVLPAIQLSGGIFLVALVAYFTYTDHASWAIIVAKYVQRRDQVDADKVFVQNVRRYNPIALATTMKAIKSEANATGPINKYAPLPVLQPASTNAKATTYYVRQSKGLRRTAKELLRMHEVAARSKAAAQVSGDVFGASFGGSQSNASFLWEGTKSQDGTATEFNVAQEEERHAIRARTQRWMYPLLRYVLPVKISLSVDQYCDEHRRSRLLELGASDLTPAVGDGSGVTWCISKEQSNSAWVAVSVAKKGDDIDKLKDAMVTVPNQQQAVDEDPSPGLKRRASIAMSEVSVTSLNHLDEEAAIVKAVSLNLQREIDRPPGYIARDYEKGVALHKYISGEGTGTTAPSPLTDISSNNNSETNLLSSGPLSPTTPSLDGTTKGGSGAAVVDGGPSTLQHFTKFLNKHLLLERVGIRCPLHGSVLYARDQTDCSVDPYDCFVVHHNQRCVKQIGSMYACPSEMMQGVRCPYALCEQHFKSNIIEFAMAQVNSGVVFVKSLGVIGVLSSLCFILTPIFYFPVMKLCLLFLTCDSSFQCLFPHCWNDPDGVFIVAAVVVLIVALLVGLGIPALLYIELSRRQRVLMPIFHKKAYFQTYNAEGPASSSDEEEEDVTSNTEKSGAGDKYAISPSLASASTQGQDPLTLTSHPSELRLGGGNPVSSTSQHQLRKRSKSVVMHSNTDLGNFVEDIMTTSTETDLRPSDATILPGLQRRGVKSFSRKPKQQDEELHLLNPSTAQDGSNREVSAVDDDPPKDFLSRLGRLLLGKDLDYRLEPDVQLVGERRRLPEEGEDTIRSPLGADEEMQPMRRAPRPPPPPPPSKKSFSVPTNRPRHITSPSHFGRTEYSDEDDIDDSNLRIPPPPPPAATSPTSILRNTPRFAPTGDSQTTPRQGSEPLVDCHFIPTYQPGERLDTVSFSEWQRFLNEDGSPMFQLYRFLEFEYITLPPFLLLYKLLVLLPIVLLDKGSLSQLIATSAIEIAFGVFVTWTEPYMSGWVDILYRAGSAHNITLLGLSAIHKVLTDSGDEDGVTLYMLITTVTYLSFVVVVLFLSALWPLIAFGIKQLLVERELNKVGMRISDLASLLLNPFMHYAPYVLPYQLYGLMRVDNIDHVHQPLKEWKTAQKINSNRKKMLEKVTSQHTPDENGKYPPPLPELPEGVKRGRLFGRRHMAKHTSSSSALTIPMFNFDDPHNTKAKTRTYDDLDRETDDDDTKSEQLRPKRSALFLAAVAGLMPRWGGKWCASCFGVSPAEVGEYEDGQVDARRKVLREIIRRQLLADEYLYGKNFVAAVRGKAPAKKDPVKIESDSATTQPQPPPPKRSKHKHRKRSKKK